MATNNAINLSAAGITGYDGAGVFTGSLAVQYNVQVGGATTHQLASVAPSATSGVALISQGAASNPVFGTVVVAGGGTGLATLTAHALLVGEGTSNVALVGPGATSGIPLIAQGSGSDPAFGTAVVAGGGTGAVSFTAHSILLGQGTSAVTALGAATNGQLPIGSTGADPVLATLTQGSGISITNGAGSITIAATSSGFSWSVVTSATQTVAVGNGYFANRGGGVAFTLPASPSLGDTYNIVAMNAGGWTIAYGSGQQIFMGNQSTTVTSGSLASTAIGDTVRLVCNVAGASGSWYVVDSMGNITVA